MTDMGEGHKQSSRDLRALVSMQGTGLRQEEVMLHRTQDGRKRVRGAEQGLTKS